MTVSEIETAARRKYNSVNNNFYSSSEIYDLIYQAELEMTTQALSIEAVDTSISTVAGTRAYNYPTRVLSIKRIEYDGNKLQPIDFRDDDVVNLVSAASPVTGTPQYYALFGGKIYLRPIPAEIKTLTIYAYKEPSPVTAITTLEIPTLFHMDIANYVASELAAKDLNTEIYSLYSAKWQQALVKAQQWQKRRLRGDAFNSVKDEDTMVTSLLGGI